MTYRNDARQKNVQAVLFDLDGVLIDSYHAWYRQFNDALKHFGHKPISQRVFRQHWGQSTEEDVRIFMPERTVAEVKNYFSRHFDEYISYLEVDPYARQVLQKMKRMRLKLGCVTNSHRDIVTKILKNTRLEKFFEVVITADDVENPKPAPDMLVRACQHLKVAPRNTLFVGDTLTDMQAGKRAGCVVIGYKTRAKLSVKNLTRFLALLEDLYR